METRRIYKCFISSPGDCFEEREACQKVIESINNGLAKHLGINFESFMWEYDVLPDMGRNGQEIIDEYVSMNLKSIFIRPLTPIGFASKNWKTIGYTTEEFLRFYEESLDYIVELASRGVDIFEGHAVLFLKKILKNVPINKRRS